MRRHGAIVWHEHQLEQLLGHAQDVTDQNGQATFTCSTRLAPYQRTMAYDDLGRVRTVTNPELGSETRYYVVPGGLTDTVTVNLTITGDGDAPVIAAGNDTGNVGEDAVQVATGNLDSTTAAGILDLFRDMATQGTTVVIATHEADIARVIDRRIEISDGAILKQ